MGASLVPRPVCGEKNQPGNEAMWVPDRTSAVIV